MVSALIVEDSVDQQKLIQLALEGLCQMQIVDRVSEALAQLQENTFDLVMVDLELVDGRSHSLLTYIKEEARFQNTIVIVLTGDKNTEEKLLCFNLGVLEYLVKPIDRRELKARVKALLQKITKKLDEVHFQDLWVKLHSHQVHIKNASGQWQLIHLTPNEYKLLVLFIENQGVVLSREKLIRRAWGDETHITDRVVDSHIYTLRKKLGAAGASIRTVYGEGYLFDPLFLNKSA